MGGRSESWPEEAGALGTSDLSVGDWVAFDVRFNADEVDEFARVTGDKSPIHVSESYARAAGLPARVVHGMLVVSYVSTFVGMFLPGRRAMLMSEKFDFVKPVPVGATVTLSARVSQVSPATNAVTLSIAGVCRGLTHLRGSVLVRVRTEY